MIAALLYAASSIALLGMMPYESIDPRNSFYAAFNAHGQPLLASLVAAGELCTMPLVVLASYLPQPRILSALARDGLLPSLLAKQSDSGNPINAILLSGLVCIVTASFAPYELLNSLISGGVLLALNLTNVALVLMRLNARHLVETSAGADKDAAAGSSGLSLCETLLLLYCALCIPLCMCLCQLGASAADAHDLFYGAIAIVLGTLLLAIALHMHHSCRPVYMAHSYLTESDRTLLQATDEERHRSCKEQFRTPFVPYTPLAAILLNCYLIVQLSGAELQAMLALFAFASLVYLADLCMKRCTQDSTATLAYHSISNSHGIVSTTASAKPAGGTGPSMLYQCAVRYDQLSSDHADLPSL
jgi:L-asparagine transporter-like permease